jgi:hypothetical protein
MSHGMQCSRCVHYLGPFRCDAFLERDIPQEILSGEFDHENPYPGDHGVRYEPLPDDPAELTKAEKTGER